MKNLFELIFQKLGKAVGRIGLLQEILDLLTEPLLPRKVAYAGGCYAPCGNWHCSADYWCGCWEGNTFIRPMQYCTACSSHGVTGCGPCGEYVQVSCTCCGYAIYER